jgi:hypothetical protein
MVYMCHLCRGPYASLDIILLDILVENVAKKTSELRTRSDFADAHEDFTAAIERNTKIDRCRANT